jgi:hypothetical protein
MEKLLILKGAIDFVEMILQYNLVDRLEKQKIKDALEVLKKEFNHRSSEN